MRWSRLLSALLLATPLALAQPACDDGGASGTPAVTPSGAGFSTVASALSRDLTPDTTDANVQALAQGGWTFATELFAELDSAVDAPANLMLSPVSIRSAFAMVYAGAVGDTATQIHDVLAYDLAADAVHPAFNGLDLALAARNLDADPTLKLAPVILRVANAFWGQNGYPWLDGYLDVLATQYGAGVASLDLQGDPDGSRDTINTWVEAKTEDRIKDLIPEGAITADTVAVLTNAVYFKSPWADPFPEYATSAQPFTRADGTAVTVDMMHHAGTVPFADGEGWTAFELPFRGGELAMTFIRPDDGALAAFESGLTAATLGSVLSALAPAGVEYAVPGFESEYTVSLKAPLEALGMTVPFSGACDLSGMVEGGSLYLQDAFHKTFIAVDEAGAEAAAATAILVGETSAPIYDHQVTLDAPFFYLIRDRATGAVLFFGRMGDPTAG